jgi:putative chitinase
MLLKIGSKGVEVEKLQNFLGIPINGNFDEFVNKSLKSWQKSNGLKDDGVAGPITLKKMGILLESDLSVPASPFKLEKLKGHVPDSVISQIPDTAAKFGITNTLRLAHFLAQCGHESGGFKSVSENLNYSADGLKKIFGKYFPGNLNESYARQPEKIASRVYGSRMGNGDEASKDGWKYRGRGYIQLTGKSNYDSFDKFVDDDIINNPDLVATKYPLMSAAWFFNNNKLWSICDKGADDATVTAVTKRVNGGTIGLADRIKHFKEYYALLK